MGKCFQKSQHSYRATRSTSARENDSEKLWQNSNLDPRKDRPATFLQGDTKFEARWETAGAYLCAANRNAGFDKPDIVCYNCMARVITRRLYTTKGETVTYKQALASAVSLSKNRICVYYVYLSEEGFEVTTSMSPATDRAKLDIAASVYDGRVTEVKS